MKMIALMATLLLLVAACDPDAIPEEDHERAVDQAYEDGYTDGYDDGREDAELAAEELIEEQEDVDDRTDAEETFQWGLMLEAWEETVDGDDTAAQSICLGWAMDGEGVIEDMEDSLSDDTLALWDADVATEFYDAVCEDVW